MSERSPAVELLPGERELWSGAPVRVRCRAVDLFRGAWVLGVAAIFAVAWSSAGKNGPPAAFVLVIAAFGGPTVLGFAYYYLVRIRAARASAVCTLTDLRVLVTTGTRRRRTESAYLDQIAEPSVVRPRPDGTGDIRLREDLEFESVVGAGAVRDQVASARAAFPGRAKAPVPPDGSAGTPVPVALETGERVLWSGRSSAPVPWWFGWTDVYYSAFGVYMAAFVFVMIGTVLTGPGAGSAFAGAAPGLVFFGAFGLFGLYLAAGRVVQRRARIRASEYLLTDRRLIVRWRLADRPVIVQPRLTWLRPPEVHGSLLVTRMEQPPPRRRSGIPSPAGPVGGGSGWGPMARDGNMKILLWPAAAGQPPVLAGLPDAPAVRDLICAAQLAARH